MTLTNELLALAKVAEVQGLLITSERLRAIAVKVDRMERTLDEIVADAQEDDCLNQHTKTTHDAKKPGCVVLSFPRKDMPA